MLMQQNLPHDESQQFKAARCYLRLLQPSDIDERYASWFQGSEHMQFYGSSAASSTQEKLREQLANFREEKNNFLYGAFDNETHQCFGNIRLGRINWEHGLSDLVVLIGDPAWLGKGFAPEIIDVGNYIAFEQFGLRKLFGAVMHSNIGSLKSYMKTGWVIEGERKAHYVVNGAIEDVHEVACFRDEWLARPERFRA